MKKSSIFLIIVFVIGAILIASVIYSVNNKTKPEDKTCSSSWSCGDWGSCISDKKTRTCTDLNNCAVKSNIPALTQDCNSITYQSDADGTWEGFKSGTHITITFQTGNVFTRYYSLITAGSCPGNLVVTLNNGIKINQISNEPNYLYVCNPNGAGYKRYGP